MPRLEALVAEAALAQLDELTTVYRDAFAEPPWNEGDSARARFAAQLREHVTWPGWRGVVARDSAGAASAFAYGAVPAFPFPATGAYGRVERLLGERVAELDGVFEVLEIAVAPAARGQGLAVRMLDRLVAGQERGAWLLTLTAARAAVALYERTGWELLATEADRDGDALRLYRHRGRPAQAARPRAVG